MPEAFIHTYSVIGSPIGIINVVVGDKILHTHTRNIENILARKDTRMLDLGWAKEDSLIREYAINNRWWDSPNTGPMIEKSENNRCWAVAVQQLNHYFGGSMAQDEIVYYGKSDRRVEDHFPHGQNINASGWPDIIPTMDYALNVSTIDHIAFQNWKVLISRGLSFNSDFPNNSDMLFSATGWSLTPPSPYTVIASLEVGLPVVVIQANQGYSAMHVMVINGYQIHSDGSVYFHYMNTDNDGHSEWRRYAYLNLLGLDVLVIDIKRWALNLVDWTTYKLSKDSSGTSFGANFSVAYYVPPSNSKGRPMDNRIKDDSDGDGIVDFDEIHRFFTDPKKEDSDRDGINDKEEIAYYTRMGKDADIDVDGLRAELDVDSDGDGDCDGDEMEGGTDMLDSTKHTAKLNCKVEPIMALLASEQIHINDRASCMDNDSIYCPIVSMGLRGNAVQVGVSAKIGSILAGSSVCL
jgi:hypothetical protein